MIGKIKKKASMLTARREISPFQSEPDMQEAWRRICRRLRAELGEEVFSSWFGRLELDSVVDGLAHLSVPTRFLKSWIQAHYADRLRRALADELGQVVGVALSLRSSARATAPRPALRVAEAEPAHVVSPAAPTETVQPFFAAPARETARDAQGDALGGSPLDRRMTFANFLIGRSNQLAHAAAQRVATHRPGQPLLYNPLYIHASVGLGKTHLVQAVAHAASESGRRVTYLTAEKFMYGFVAALKGAEHASPSRKSFARHRRARHRRCCSFCRASRSQA
jgi:chromosomal replication initiator protein